MKKHFAKLKNILITDQVDLSQEERNRIRFQYPDTDEGQQEYAEEIKKELKLCLEYLVLDKKRMNNSLSLMRWLTELCLQTVTLKDL